MKTTNKSKKHQVSDAGIRAVRAGDWENRAKGCCAKHSSSKPTIQDSVFGPLPSEKLAGMCGFKKVGKGGLRGALQNFTATPSNPPKPKGAMRRILKAMPKELKRTLLRDVLGRFAPKPETKETVAALADAVQSQGQRKSIMERAIEVRKARNQTYGGPGPEWTCQASMLNAYMRRRFGHAPVIFQAHDIGVINAIQKLSRHASCMSTGNYHQDNMVDLAGFADCIDEVLTPQQRPLSMDALIKFLTSAE